jgi:hypothetical protein
MNHIQNMLTGYASILNLFPNPRLFLDSDHGFSDDRARMRENFSSVANDFKKVLKRYDQSGKSASYK